MDDAAYITSIRDSSTTQIRVDSLRDRYGKGLHRLPLVLWCSGTRRYIMVMSPRRGCCPSGSMSARPFAARSAFPFPHTRLLMERILGSTWQASVAGTAAAALVVVSGCADLKPDAQRDVSRDSAVSEDIGVPHDGTEDVGYDDTADSSVQAWFDADASLEERKDDVGPSDAMRDP